MAALLKIICCVLLFGVLNAKDLGTNGHIYPIFEESLLDIILKRLSQLDEKDVQSLQHKIKDHYIALLEEPNPIDGLFESPTERIYYYDPSFICQENVFDHQGNLIVEKGTRINPLEISTPRKDLLFIDGSKESHVIWARKQGDQTIWILVKGRPLDLEKTEERPVYFDQFGQLVKKFKIKHVPVKISSDGLHLKIREIPLNEVEL